LKQNVFWQREEVADDDVRLLKWTTYDATHVPVDYDGDTPISQVRTLCSRAVLTHCSLRVLSLLLPELIFLFSLSDSLSTAVPVLIAV
jgi:hypothetical protein